MRALAEYERYAIVMIILGSLPMTFGFAGGFVLGLTLGGFWWLCFLGIPFGISVFRLLGWIASKKGLKVV